MPVGNSILNHITSSTVTKQGIVTILGSDSEGNGSAASIRRTLSADMSSKKWLEQDGFLSPVKKIVSSSDSSSSSEVEEEFYRTPGVDDVWTSIQASKEIQKPTKMESWGSILSQTNEKSLPPPSPYVHPLVKRSASGLSERSLDICTECLGSETGTDCFSSSSSTTTTTTTCSIECLSEGDEAYKENRHEFREYSDPFAGSRVKHKNSPARSLPPPLPSIAGGRDGSQNLRMQSRRENGRLILEAVSFSPKNYLHAQRRDGRLLLTWVCSGETAEGNKEDEGVFDNMEEVGEDVPVEDMVDGGGDGGFVKEDEIVLEKNLSLSSGMVGVHKKWVVMKKFLAMGNMNATWTNKEDNILPPQSLPPLSSAVSRSIPTAAASFNAYEYFWRSKTKIVVSNGFVKPGSENVKTKNSDNDNNNNNNNVYEIGDLVIMNGNKGEQLVSYLRGCKESRRSLLNWEPYCIATS